MRGFERILCPSDFSAFSHRALAFARALVMRPGGRLRALHVVRPLHSMSRGGAATAPALEASGDRESFLERLRRFVEPVRVGVSEVELAVATGDVSAAILDEARTWAADLIVMGTRGLGGRHGWVVGSVTESVLFRSPCPLLAVPGAGEIEANGPAVPFEQILCPIDFSEPSRDALEHAVALARHSGARLTLLHIVEWLPDEHLSASVALCIPELHLNLTEEARGRMLRFAPPGTFVGLDHEELVATGQPHRAILRFCRERRVDLIVLGIHGRRALDKSLAGATVTHLMRQAGCPIFAVSSQ
jgi:nucleotide-binding universal stress UspA family protein